MRFAAVFFVPDALLLLAPDLLVDFDAVDFAPVDFAADFDALALVPVDFAVDFDALDLVPADLEAVDLVPVDFEAVDFAPVDFFAVAVVAVDELRPDDPPELLDPLLAADLPSFFVPLTTSLKCCPALNFGTAVFLIFTDAPVRGLRPVRAGRVTRSNTPNPVIATRSPLATARVMVSTTASTASAAPRLPPRRPDSVSISVALFTCVPSERRWSSPCSTLGATLADQPRETTTGHPKIRCVAGLSVSGGSAASFSASRCRRQPAGARALEVGNLALVPQGQVDVVETFE